MTLHSFCPFWCGKLLAKVTTSINLFDLLFSNRLPFGIHSVFVYYAIVLLQYGIWYFITTIFFCSMGSLVTLCKMVSMFMKDLTADWRRLDRINKTGVRQKFIMKFHDLIGIHSQIIQLSRYWMQSLTSFSKKKTHTSNVRWFVFHRFALQMTYVCQYIITSLYLWSIILICFSLLGTLITVVKCTNFAY